jgi:hypothetical protein
MNLARLAFLNLLARPLAMFLTGTMPTRVRENQPMIGPRRK